MTRTRGGGRQDHDRAVSFATSTATDYRGRYVLGCGNGEGEGEGDGWSNVRESEAQLRVGVIHVGVITERGSVRQ